MTPWPPPVEIEQPLYWCATCPGIPHQVKQRGGVCPVCVDVAGYRARSTAHDIEAHRTAYLLELDLWHLGSVRGEG